MTTFQQFWTTFMLGTNINYTKNKLRMKFSQTYDVWFHRDIYVLRSDLIIILRLFYNKGCPVPSSDACMLCMRTCSFRICVFECGVIGERTCDDGHRRGDQWEATSRTRLPEQHRWRQRRRDLENNENIDAEEVGRETTVAPPANFGILYGLLIYTTSRSLYIAHTTNYVIFLGQDTLSHHIMTNGRHGYVTLTHICYAFDKLTY